MKPQIAPYSVITRNRRGQIVEVHPVPLKPVEAAGLPYWNYRIGKRRWSR